MLKAKLFENTNIKCADNYIMISTYECDCEELIDIISKYGVNEIILSPAKSIMRITLKSPLVDTDTNVITTTRPTISFLKKLWDLKVSHINNAIKTYMMQGEVKILDNNIKIWKDNKWIIPLISSLEREWITNAVLGSTANSN